MRLKLNAHAVEHYRSINEILGKNVSFCNSRTSQWSNESHFAQQGTKRNISHERQLHV